MPGFQAHVLPSGWVKWETALRLVKMRRRSSPLPPVSSRPSRTGRGPSGECPAAVVLRPVGPGPEDADAKHQPARLRHVTSLRRAGIASILPAAGTGPVSGDVTEGYGRWAVCQTQAPTCEFLRVSRWRSKC